MRIGFYTALIGLLWVTACDKNIPAPPPVKEVAPEIKLEPPPGSYQAFRMDVTATSLPDHVLYFGLDTAPAVTPARAYAGSFSVRLIRSTRLLVSVQTPGGKLHGPYTYEYALTPLVNDGACQLSDSPQQYYKGNDPLAFTLQYVMPAALAKLEYGVNGVWQELVVDDHLGAVDLDLGALPEGAYNVECRVTLGNKKWTGNLIDFVVDTTPPTGAWVTSGFSFDQATWRNVIDITASDALSGLASAALCNAQNQACVPLQEPAPGQFIFTTALTDGTNLSTPLFVHLTDVAGNTFDVAQQTFDFSSFADAVPPRAPLPITYTTGDTFDMAAVVGPGIADVRRTDGTVLLGTESANAVALAPGANEFLYRKTGTGHWQSFAIYRAGLEVILPPTSGQWLIFSSASTLPAMQSQLEQVVAPAYTTSSTTWSHPWFAEVPNVFFVEDLDIDAVWTQADNLYVDPATGWTGSSRAFNEPVRIEQIEVYAAVVTPFSKVVTVSVAGGLPAGDLFFQWRATWSTFPDYHLKLSPGAYPFAVSVPADGICVFYLNVYGHGAVSSDVPRVSRPCTEETFFIDNRSGSLAAVTLPYYTLPWLSGIPYGSQLTSVITVTDTLGFDLVSYPIRPLSDESGLGFEFYPNGFDIRYPNLPALVQFYDGTSTVDWEAGAPPETMPAATIDVWVADETGTSQRALVLSGSGSEQPYAAAAAGQWTPVPVSGDAPYTLYAMRDGWLSEKSVTAGTSVTLRLLSAAVTGMLSGTLTDGVGPIGNAEIVWENAGYTAGTRSASDGTYALPASGGDGVVTITTHTHSSSMTVSYALSITKESRIENLIAPREADVTWPAGIHSGLVPSTVTGPSAAVLQTGNFDYGLTVTGASEGLWSAEWPYIRRYFSLPGALPSYPTNSWDYLPITTYQGLLSNMETFARCGDWEQATQGGILATWPCWSWLANDGNQTYALGKLLNDEFPLFAGMGVIQATVTQFGGAPLFGLQTLVLHDRILAGRTILVTMNNGLVNTAIPAGLYDVKREDGTQLQKNWVPAVVLISSNDVATFSMTYPP